MKCLSKKQFEQRAALVADLRKQAALLEKAVADLDAAVAAATPAIASAVVDYNAAREAAEAFVGEIAQEATEYHGERSEKWQESDAGQAYKSFADEWEGAYFEELEIELPEDLEVPELDAADILEGLPEEP
jgi:hypothetical protein